MDNTVPDRIEKKIVLKAAPRRVWEAISNVKQFGTWFGVDFDAPFSAGQRLTGRLTPTKVDPETAKSQKAYEGRAFEITVDRVEPENHLSFFWHPFAIDERVDYSSESKTRVSFDVSPAPGGTLLTVTETGFSKVPLARRATAFAANEGGWEKQTQLIEKYLQQHG